MFKLSHLKCRRIVFECIIIIENCPRQSSSSRMGQSLKTPWESTYLETKSQDLES